MNPEHQKAVLTIALLAAFADGANDEREREEIRRLAESLGEGPGAPDVAGLYRDVLLKRVGLAAAAAALDEPGHRQLAYEMAVCVCDADGRATEAERDFLAGLARALGLDAGITAPIDRQGEAMAELAEAAVPAVAPMAPMAPMASGPVVAAMANVPEAELDRSILNYAILNGALELLPQSWASMAIIPLQMKMVYRIGKAHGYELDQGHIRELLATLGVGLTSQYLEQFGRKLLGGLLGKVAGGLGRQAGRAATGIAFSFATTYALGHVGKRYYASGRQMDGALLKETFRNLLEPAKRMQAEYLPQIRQQAESLDMAKVMSLVRGQ
jgi:uncharacterized protein (DUF697 family)/tellurite resistance protein